jgi:hypothetical protein
VSKQILGGDSRQCFQIHFQIPLNNQTAPASSNMAATNRASHPSGSSDQRCSAFALAALPPQKIVGAASRPIDVAQIHGYRIPMPTPCWLTLQAIRLVARATAYDIPFRLMALRQTPYSGFAVAVVTHAKQRLASKGFRSFSMW